MIKKETIEKIVQEFIHETPLFIVDITIKTGNNISVYIDNETTGIFIEDCIRISKHIEENLNRDEEDFALEVSSAGIEKPFKVYKQYLKNIGKQIKVVTIDKKELKGKLTDVQESNIVIEAIAKKKPDPATPITIPFDQIKTTTLIITFN